MDKETIRRDEEMSDLEAQLYYEEWVEKNEDELFEQFLKEDGMLKAWNRHTKFFEGSGEYGDGIKILFLQDHEDEWESFVKEAFGEYPR